MLENNQNPQIQVFCDGVLSINGITRHDDGSETLTVKHPLLRYDERTVGINRFYNAKQESVEISLVLRVQRHDGISTQDVAVLSDGRQFHIRQVQHPKGVSPPCCDLSLERVVRDYELG